jgi:sec-independent protein translocase protein TatB
MISSTKILLVLVIVLLVVGPRRLPELARQLGRYIRQFRAMAGNLTHEMGAEDLVDDLRTLNQARGTFAQTIRTELGLDELAQSMNLDGHDEEQVAAAGEQSSTDAPVFPDAVSVDPSVTILAEAPSVPAKPQPVRTRTPKVRLEATDAASTTAAPVASAAVPKPRRAPTPTAKTKPSEPV